MLQKAKMKDMGEQLEDMSSELSKLRVENNSLKNRNTILEKVLALRDEHIRMLQDEQQVRRIPWLSVHPGAARILLLFMAVHSKSRKGSEYLDCPLVAGEESSALLTYVHCALAELQVFDLGNHYLQSSNQKLLTGGSVGAGALALGTTSGPLTTSEIKAVKGMPADMVIGRWKETVRELGNILVQVRCWRPPAVNWLAALPTLRCSWHDSMLRAVQIEGCPDTNDQRHQAAMNALCQVLDQAGQLCMHTAVLHPTNMQKLIAATLDDGRSGVSADDRNRWAAVTQSLQLR